ncbi:MAG TPA: DUF4080 domain-containing protein [Methylomirabilota bacterium]|nr:DUF4080 domain-containing protein [Methylomirabilota bacterium]
MAEIVLTTLNAKYIHAAFGLRYLLANMGELKARTELIEFHINQRALDITEAILNRKPKIVGMGVYIWNARLTLEVARVLKRLQPELLLVLGGPEVSYEWEKQAVVATADYVITGEADLAFRQLVDRLLNNERPAQKVIHAPLPDPAKVALPYDLYTEQDVKHRIIYVEASRGCAFTCEFCLSSLDVPVRQFPLEPFLAEMEKLLARGVQHFKFVDRTFNLNLNTSRALLTFFLERYTPGLFLHFEMIPDRLPEALRGLIAKFPPGALQFEVGIQSFNDEVCARIKRRQSFDRLRDNFAFLRQHTGVHIHADLIAGLPGEDVASFARGFNELVALAPQEIQVGILKRLRGTPIIRHDAEWDMRYNAEPPYEILSNRSVSFAQMQELRRFAKFWDLLGNSGNFAQTTPLLWQEMTPFDGVMAFTRWVYPKANQTSGIALARLAEYLFEFLVHVQGMNPSTVGGAMWSDFQRTGRQDAPPFLRPHLPATNAKRVETHKAPKRQARHLAANA